MNKTPEIKPNKSFYYNPRESRNQNDIVPIVNIQLIKNKTFDKFELYSKDQKKLKNQLNPNKSIAVTNYKTTMSSQSIVNSAFDKNLDSNVNFIYGKVFPNKIHKIIFPTAKNENKEKLIRSKADYMDDKVKQIKSKVYFMKGIFDYSFPQIISYKFSILNKMAKNNLEKQKLKNIQRVRMKGTNKPKIEIEKYLKIEKINYVN